METILPLAGAWLWSNYGKSLADLEATLPDAERINGLRRT